MSSTIRVGAALLGWLVMPVVYAQSGPVQIRVELKTDKEYKYKSDELTRRRAIRQLEVIVKNLGAKPLERAVVKYYLFARDVDLDLIDAVGMGEETVDIGAMRATTVRSKPVSVTHRVQDDAGGKFVGHAVQVFQGETVIGALYEPKDMQVKFDKAIADAPNSVSRWEAVEKKLWKGKKK